MENRGDAYIGKIAIKLKMGMKSAVREYFIARKPAIARKRERRRILRQAIDLLAVR